MNKTKERIYDLRTALEFLKDFPEELHITDQEVDPVAELAGVYRYIGAGGTVQRPTKTGPAMIFNHVKGYPGKKVVIGLLANRRRVGRLLGVEPEKISFLLKDCLSQPIPPVIVGKEKAKCQEVIFRTDEEDFDIRRIIPASTNTPEDAGPYITMGMCYATHPDTGVSDMTIHRLCLQDKDTLSIYFTPGARHIGAMFDAAERKNQPLPISVSIGVDPAIEMATCFEPPTTPLGYNELGIAGALRNRPVELTDCLLLQPESFL